MKWPNWRAVLPGGLLLLATVCALILANTQARSAYESVSHFQIGPVALGLHLPVVEWINDAFMALFFFVVAVEIKHEVLQGALSSRNKALLPVAAALGGMMIPAIIFTAFNPRGDHSTGWGIPMATDIAFAVAGLSLLGDRVPRELRALLLTLAIVDDLGAILVIALFYSHHLYVPAMLAAAALCAALYVFARHRRFHMAPYLLLAVLLWWCIWRSGVHATIAGVIFAFVTPLRHHGVELATRLARPLQAWIALAILPLFALTNAGLYLPREELARYLSDPVTAGVTLGLLIGKPLGIVLACWIAVRFLHAHLPARVQWTHVWLLGLFGGIGFTMSLFIAHLASSDAAFLTCARLGIFLGSLLSVCAAVGIGMLLPLRETPVTV